MKNLKDTLKELYEEVPRNWSHIRCTEKTYEAIRNGAVMRVLNMPTSSLQDLQIVVDEAINRDDILALYDRSHQFVRSVEFSQSCDVKTFQCGTGEMGTLYWSKDADLDKLPEMLPASTEGMSEAMQQSINGVLDYHRKKHPDCPICRANDTSAASRQSQPESDSSTQTPMDTAL